ITDGAWTFILPDALGSVRQTTSITGAVTGSREWSPFGVEVDGTQAGLGYTGEWYDVYLQQLYLRARWYDSRTGRFTIEDKVPGYSSIPRSLHIYVYAWNAPINLIDPSGLQVPVTERCAPSDVCWTGTAGVQTIRFPSFQPPPIQPAPQSEVPAATGNPSFATGCALGQICATTPTGQMQLTSRSLSAPDFRTTEQLLLGNSYLPFSDSDGVLLRYAAPWKLQGHIELIEMHGEGSLLVGETGAEYKTVYTFPLLNGEAAEVYQETTCGVKPGIAFPVLGGVTVGYEHSTRGTGPGENAFVVEVELSMVEIALQDSVVEVGMVPDIGPGMVFGVTYAHDVDVFLTSRGYLRTVGLAKFGKQRAPDKQLENWWIYEGYWSNATGNWVSGLQVARTFLGPQWANRPYKEVP
ncbi:MAG: RHS repeat-associated core domain-containing protein, partial [Anaerolineae bacterium]|nr:RHS repeat-associated core domain-containing protein [Anaerolineae bacterium]